MGLVRASFIHLPQIKINMNNKLQQLILKFAVMFTTILYIILLCTMITSCKPVNFADCNHMPTKLRCTAIKFNGKQCLNKAARKSALCKYHLEIFYPANK